MSKWIKCSEQMPEPYEYVLVTDGFVGCEVMRVNSDGYWGLQRVYITVILLTGCRYQSRRKCDVQ